MSAGVADPPAVNIPFRQQERVGDGPYDWLEDGRDSSENVDQWINRQNARTTQHILRGADIKETVLYKERLALLASLDKIPFVGSEEAGFVYNFWQDKNNVRGLWRRTTLEQYSQPNTEWENLLDIDAFNKENGTSWAGDSAWCWQQPLPGCKRALLTMSPGGNDKTHLFEFDFASQRFVTPMDQGGDGFSIRDEAKMRIAAYDADTIYVSTPLPDHDEWGGVTESTYARVLKKWVRGVHLDYRSAETVLEVPRDFMWIDPEVDTYKYAISGIETRRVFVDARPSFYRHRIVHLDPATNEPTRLALPDALGDVYMSYFDYYVFTLRDAKWGFAADSLLVCHLDELLEVSRHLQAARGAAGEGAAGEGAVGEGAVGAVGEVAVGEGAVGEVAVGAGAAVGAEAVGAGAGAMQEHDAYSYLVGELVMSDADAQRLFFPLFTPTASSTLCRVVGLRDFLVLVAIDDVKSKLIVWESVSQTRRAGVSISRAFRPSAVRTPWSDANFDVVGAFSRHADGSSNELLIESFGFLKPVTVEMVDVGVTTTASAAQPAVLPRLLKASPARFDTSGMSVRQEFATSADGTRVPFFVVGKGLEEADDATRRNGDAQPRPLLLYGYGAHGAVMTPGYNWPKAVGSLWLARGGLFALANIRGGGEYGFRWHEAGAPNRLKAYEDFESVASHLIQKLRLTAPHKLACMGESMGGCLTANMLTRDNGLFAAVVSECPVADLERFRFLGMGHSWIPELGDPSTPEGWQVVQQYSPLHRITPRAARRFDYPKALFVSSSNDDRTHPAHGRKMVAKMDHIVGEGAGCLLLEESEGGHGGNADIEQVARADALVFYFLWQSLAPEAGAPLMQCGEGGSAESQAKRQRER